MSFHCTSFMQMMILTTELILKVILTALFMVDSSLKTFGVAMLSAMWSPVFILVVEWITRRNLERTRISLHQLVLLLILIPLAPILTRINQLNAIIFAEDTNSGFINAIMDCGKIISSWIQIVILIYGILVDRITFQGRHFNLQFIIYFYYTFQILYSTLSLEFWFHYL